MEIIHIPLALLLLNSCDITINIFEGSLLFDIAMSVSIMLL
jgi:hypothetical protein